MSQLPVVTFGSHNRGVEVGQNHGPINTEIHLPPERPETPPDPFHSIPYCRDPDFVNRGDILDQIASRCSECPGRMALVGLGGVGKSQLAIEYAYRVYEQADDTWVFWIHAENKARVKEGFKTIADMVKLPGRNQQNADVLQLVYTWLSNERNGKWLMVLDSADTHDVFYGKTEGDANGRLLATYLPQSSNGSIVVTTRDGSLASRLNGSQRNSINVGPMVEADGLSLLQNRLGSESPWDVSVATDLVRALDLVPLAISQAGAYISERTPRCSLTKYLADFRESEGTRIGLLGHDAGDLRRDGGASNSVLTTWQISFDDIRAKRPSAADLLSLMSFFDRQGIPEEVLSPSAEDIHELSQAIPGIRASLSAGGTGDSETPKKPAPKSAVRTLKDYIRNIRSIKRWSGGKGKAKEVPGLSNANRDEAPRTSPDASGDRQARTGNRDADIADTDNDFEDNIAMLRAYSLITANEHGDLFEMHGLVQLSTRRWLEASGQQEGFKLQFIERLATLFPFPKADLSNVAACQKLFAHVELALEYHPGNDGLENWSWLLFKGGYYAMDQGRYEVAERMARTAKRADERRVGEEHLDTAKSATILADVLINEGAYAEAEKLCKQVVATLRRLLGSDHDLILGSMRQLAWTLSAQDRLKEAEELQWRVMEASKTKLGLGHVTTIDIMGDYGHVLRRLGRLEEAEKLYAQVLATRKTVLGPNHPNTLRTMHNLALVFYQHGRLEKAEEMSMQVLETRKAVLGPDHPDTLTTMGNLASVFYGQGRLKEAEKMHIQVLGTRKAVLGPDHPDTLTTMYNLALVFYDQGRFEEAEKMNMQVLGTRKAVLGPEHPDTLFSMYNLAWNWKEQGRHADALALMESCAQGEQRVLGGEHPRALKSMEMLERWRRE